MKIKVLTLLLLLSAYCLNSVYAQPFHGGILAGFAATQVDGDSHGGYNKAGFQGGVFVNAKLTDLISAQFEIKYTGKGAKKPVSSNSPSVYSLTLHYIDLPLSVNARVKQIGSVEIGLIPAYLFAAQGEDDGGKLPDEYLVTFRKFDLQSLVGININIAEKLMLNLRYSYSLISIRDEDAINNHYTWFGKILGRKTGDYNNCLTAALYYRIK